MFRYYASLILFSGRNSIHQYFYSYTHRIMQLAGVEINFNNMKTTTWNTSRIIWVRTIFIVMTMLWHRLAKPNKSIQNISARKEAAKSGNGGVAHNLLRQSLESYCLLLRAWGRQPQYREGSGVTDCDCLQALLGRSCYFHCTLLEHYYFSLRCHQFLEYATELLSVFGHFG